MTSDLKECHVRLTRRDKSYARQKLCRQSDSPKNPEQREQNPSKQSQARRSISFKCSTATSSSSTPIDEEVRGLADLGSRVVQND